MLLKTKISLGLGFLFLIILTLSAFCAYFVGKSSKDAENILSNNYNSIVYSREMLAALDDMLAVINGPMARPGQAVAAYSRRLFDKGAAAFEKNLQDENGNITEIHEKEYVQRLNAESEILLKLGRELQAQPGRDQSAADNFRDGCNKARQSINAIYDLNLQAVVRKSQMAENETSHFMNSMAIIGALCILLALAYFWYFPFYISNTYSYLSSRMQRLLDKLGITHDTKTKDEAFVLLEAIDLLENTLAAKKE
jgi:hypothetical protein